MGHSDNIGKHSATLSGDMPGLAREMHVQLQRYIEAQYPIRHASVIAERHALLETAAVISQEPFIESMPGYTQGKAYNALALPIDITEALAQLAHRSLLPTQLYQHQTNALEAFLKDGRDLIVVTGTGSGKTETFLLPILARALEETQQRPDSFRLPGMRTLLLYPMNALVNDQLTRLRRLFGNPQFVSWFHHRYHAPRPLRFGMYTSRTPYPGIMSKQKNQDLLSLLNDYIQLEGQRAQELKALGRWPALDLEALYKHTAMGETAISGHDYELYTRHQMQTWCPDLLITNYSMLEYMLMRPIERSLFAQTASWLAQDQTNTLLIVLDEAHLYSGVTGAEISLLLRRLQARLGITRNRVRYILTSASLDTGTEGQQAILDFAHTLVDQPRSSFTLIQGRRVNAPHSSQGQAMTREQEAVMLSNFNLQAFANRVIAPEDGQAAVATLAKHFDWPSPPQDEQALSRYLGQHLPHLQAFQQLWQSTAGQAVAFHRLAQQIFPALDEQARGVALSALLVLAATALTEEEVSLLPVRAHLFFRGLPPLYVCINPHCHARRAKDNPADIGALWLSARLHCTCGGRVYELYGHRSCGAIFLRAFAATEPANFYWHEPGESDDDTRGRRKETLLLIGKTHPKAQNAEPLRFHIATGQVTPIRPERLQSLYNINTGEEQEDIIVYRQADAPATKSKQSIQKIKQRTEDDENGDDTTRQWKSCPVCRKRLNEASITSFATKGEQPFVNLVRRQFELQPPSEQATEFAPNMGRKVLLFSDGRQRAARLARDLPREVELDTFRQALLLAVAQQCQRDKQPLIRMDQALYRSFVAVCAEHRLYFFDGESQKELLRHIHEFRNDYDADIGLAESDEWEPAIPQGYRLALLRQVADSFYSMQRMCAAVVEPTAASLRILGKKALFARLQGQDLRALAIAWIEALLSDGAFDAHIAPADRVQLLPREGFVPTGEETKAATWNEAEKVSETILGYSNSELQQLRQAFIDEFCESKEGYVFLRPEKLALRLTINGSWHQCRDCSQLIWLPLRNQCPNPDCGGSQLIQLPGNDASLRARTDFYREPIHQVIEGQRIPTHLTAEEHTAQLSYRDKQETSTTTERYELRFQNIGLSAAQPSIDVLSCTTTMEVGVDIGSLLGIGLRTMPPRRANYQQRAGRAGRRSAALATVLAYSENGSHDAHYFTHPDEMIAGALPCPHISKVNQRLARRHIQAVLLQTFFLEQVEAPGKLSEKQSGYLAEALGTVQAFFHFSTPHNLAAFEYWLDKMLTDIELPMIYTIAAWLPDELVETALNEQNKLHYVRTVARELISRLRHIGEQLFPLEEAAKGGDDFAFHPDEMMFLDLLFEHGLLPSYAFPREVRSFVIEEWKQNSRGNKRVGIKQRPEQSVDVALAEYVPGRELIVDKETYRVGGIYVDPFPGATVANRVPSLFKQTRSIFAFCTHCGYTHHEELSTTASSNQCPLCQKPLTVEEILDPPGFAPERARSLEQSRQHSTPTAAERTATQVKLVLPLTDEEDFGQQTADGRVAWSYAEHRDLLLANCGPGNRGFSVCRSCGAAAPGEPLWLHKPHERPFLVPNWMPVSRLCNGSDGIWKGYLGHIFHSDLLLLRLRWPKGVAYQIGQPWMRDAFDTLAQAFLLAATRLLDIAPSELQVGWSYTVAAPNTSHLTPPRMADFFLFDTLSGGAGYATQVGRYVEQLLKEAQYILDTCPERCERSCYRCLRNYANRIQHHHLDRRLAGTLLRAIISGEPPASFSVAQQAGQLAMLQQFLELSGEVTCECTANVQGQIIPLLVKTDYGSYAIGTYPVQQDRDITGHPLDVIKTRPVRLFSDYELTHNLPDVAGKL